MSILPTRIFGFKLGAFLFGFGVNSRILGGQVTHDVGLI